jgi:tetratricopeptide (TPR) repeat protein
MSVVSDTVPLTWQPDELLALALSRPSEALAAARQVLAQNPTAAKAGDLDRESDILASLGVARLLAGQTLRGLSVLDALVRNNSGVPAGRILIRRSYAFWVLGRGTHALRDAQDAVDLLSGAGDPVWEARALHHRAMAYSVLGDTERADRDYARAETLYAACGQHLEYANVREERAEAAHARGDLPTALAHLDHAQDLFDQLGVFEAELAVNKITVLLAAGLARDALREADAAVSTIERDRGSAAWRARAAVLLCPAAAATATWARAAPGAGPSAVPPPAPVVGGAAELILLSAGSRARIARPAGAARQVTGGWMDGAEGRSPPADGRLALAQGQRDEAATCDPPRHPAPGAALSQHRLAAQATWCRRARRGMLAACDRGQSARPAPADAGRRRAARWPPPMGGASGHGVALCGARGTPACCLSGANAGGPRCSASPSARPRTASW